MLRIWLYKNCILNNKYQEVISNRKINEHSKSVLDEYLDTLERMFIQADTTYYENSYEIVLSDDDLVKPYEYNYMKVQEFNAENKQTLEKYCFINDIVIKNGCAYIRFEEDIFSTYFKDVNSQVCQLIASRLCDYNNRTITLRKLPIEYDGNNELEIEKIVTTTRCKVLCEIQTYIMENGLYNTRQSHLCVVECAAPDNYEDISGNWKKSFTAYGLRSVFKQLLRFVGSEYPRISEIPFGQQGYEGKYFYDIGNIYIIPDSFYISNLYESAISGTNVNYSIASLTMVNQMTQQNPIMLFQELKAEYKYNKNDVLSYDTPSDLGIISIGTYSSQIPTEFNATDIEYTFSLSYDDMNVFIQLNTANKIIDVTKDFLYVQHYNLVSSEQSIQRKIEIEMTNANLDKSLYDMKDREIYYGFNAIKNLLGAGENAINENAMRGITNAISIGEQGAHAYYNEEIQNKINLQKTIINQPRYCNSKGNFVTSQSFMSYFAPLYKMKVLPDNLEIVKNTIKNLGYRVFEYINVTGGFAFDNLFNPDNAVELNAHYDFIKILEPNVYGKFTNEIAKTINRILASGVKIWYDSSLSDDNYSIDNF